MFRILVAWIVAWCSLNIASAQTLSFGSLLSQGYEVKAMTFIAGGAAILVQKGASAFFCFRTGLGTEAPAEIGRTLGAIECHAVTDLIKW
jgi:hypothetical protein